MSTPDLVSKLYEYNKSNPARFHMPGHKGKMPAFDLYGMDITEIDGFDDLHNPTGSILKINEELAALYKAKSARLLVNGSTCGIMAAFFALTKEGGKVLISRNSHKSLYNSLILRKARPVFINPRLDENLIPLPVELSDIKDKIKENPDIELVVLTSPTYEGVVSNIKDIKAYLQEKNIPLLVDAAHGAHLGILPGNFSCPITQGADVAVTSLHKSLPFLTQTSALLVSENNKELLRKIDFYLHCFITSSPSYVLMAGAQKGIELIKKDGEALFYRLDKNIDKLKEKAKKLKNIKIFSKSYGDPSKLVFISKKEGGAQTIENCLKRKNVIPEMTMVSYVLCMAGIMNEPRDFDLLLEGLKEADLELEAKKDKIESLNLDYSPNLQLEIPMHRAMEMDRELVSIEEAKGRISADFVDIYPPGIPVFMPGSIIGNKDYNLVKYAKEHNINIRGLNGDKILVVK